MDLNYRIQKAKDKLSKYNENVPCITCGRKDLPLHVNYECPECYEIPQKEDKDE